MIPSYFDFSPIGKRRLAMTLSPETRKAIEKHLAGDYTADFGKELKDGWLRQCLEEIDNVYSECRAIHRIENERAIETMALKRKLNACVEALIWYADGNDEFNIVEAKDNSFLCTMEGFSSRAKAALEKVRGK